MAIGESEFGEQYGHLGPACDERLGTDVYRHAGELLGAQYATESITRVEYGDIGAIPERSTDPVGSDQT
jgi:hypothetical protein